MLGFEYRAALHIATRESDMKQSDHFRENAENCARLAERSTDGPTYKRYKRMEASGEHWLKNRTGWTARSLRPNERAGLIGSFWRRSAIGFLRRVPRHFRKSFTRTCVVSGPSLPLASLHLHGIPAPHMLPSFTGQARPRWLSRIPSRCRNRSRSYSRHFFLRASSLRTSAAELPTLSTSR